MVHAQIRSSRKGLCILLLYLMSPKPLQLLVTCSFSLYCTFASFGSRPTRIFQDFFFTITIDDIHGVGIITFRIIYLFSSSSRFSLKSKFTSACMGLLFFVDIFNWLNFFFQLYIVCAFYRIPRANVPDYRPPPNTDSSRISVTKRYIKKLYIHEMLVI